MTEENETLRADARRNRARVLEAAQSAFSAQGLTVPLGEIARRAGVGAGTVYRHFPSKELLFRAVVEGGIRQFTEEAVRLADAKDAGAAFFLFIKGVVARASDDKALRDVFAAAAEEPVTSGRETTAGFAQALEVLLTRAQEAGEVRQDADLADVRALLVGALAMERHRSAAGGTGRAVGILCDGLRAPGTGPVAALPAPKATVTKRRAAAAGRNGMPGGGRNEMTVWLCETCAGPLSPAPTGRPPRFCGAACRQKAHRRRARGSA
ncbi:TetR/AcrR family transcriptional regulator [Streptomyces sp. XD-27]|uniref:TetR/AcrR family transcriptional regulator n=1 Tax=Streptomyces sp. XD-27 TaxID=3062779 RepID=UPI0026F47DBC|nr:TetR/AcrR family transcriptional regulator [Streptomyces sp. XD-27]WKX71529.1 TetR/AcrR family transcriptional regulator [Streptomyces sp. XD-27]